MDSIKLSDFLPGDESKHRMSRALWELKKTKAEYVVRAGQDEVIYGDTELTAEEIASVEKRFVKKSA